MFYARDGVQVVPFAIGANKVFLCTREHADAYRAHLEREKLGTARWPRTMFGAPVLYHDFKPVPVSALAMSTSSR